MKVLRKDWRFQVASLGEEWWVNKVGTYGMASAQSYWGRLAALLGDALKGHREGTGPHPMGNCCMSAGEVDAPATLGLEDGHHHGGETPQGGQDAGVHAAVPLQHALRPVLPLLAEVLLVGLQRC